MYTHLTDLTKGFLYYSIAILLCLGVTLLSPLLGGHVTVAAMFTPAVSVLLMLLVVTRDGYSPHAWRLLALQRAGLQGWGLALVVPTFVLGFAYGGLWLSGWASFAVPSGLVSIGSYLFDLVSSVAIVTLLGGVGEEVGWRGFLLPKLRGLGLNTALIISGLLHGLWHLPMIVLTPFYHSEGNRLITIPLFLLTLTMAGVCYGYLRITTASIWPAALSHSFFNILWERFNAFTSARSAVAVEYLAGESGVLTLAALVAIAVWLMYVLKRAGPSLGNRVQSDAI